MLKKTAWLTAAAAVALMIGCDSKPADKIPTTAPMAIKAGSEQEVLAHLQYMAVRKDMKHAHLIVPVDPEVVYASAWWFNKHAGELGIPYTQEEVDFYNLKGLKDMGYIAIGPTRHELGQALDKIQGMKGAKLPENLQAFNFDKLDQLPTTDKLPNGKPNPDFDLIKTQHIRGAVTGGLYRVMKGIPAELWPDIAVMEIKPSPGNAKVKDVFLSYKGTFIMQVSLYQSAPDKPLGISYVYYKIGLKKLNQVAAQLKETPAK